MMLQSPIYSDHRTMPANNENSIYSDLNYSLHTEEPKKRLPTYQVSSNYQERSLEIEDLSLLTIDTMELPTFVTSEHSEYENVWTF